VKFNISLCAIESTPSAEPLIKLISFWTKEPLLALLTPNSETFLEPTTAIRVQFSNNQKWLLKNSALGLFSLCRDIITQYRTNISHNKPVKRQLR
jgi:hypothetical protein